MKEVCRKCHKEFETSKDLQVHVKIHDQEKNSRSKEKCDKCDKEFFSKDSLKAHINNAHNSVKFTCDLCHASFAFPTGLKYHKKKVHQGIRYHYQCVKCEKGYQSYYNLKWHMKTQHQGLKLKCEFCPSYFSHQSTLIKHLASKHNSKKSPKMDLVRVDEGDELFQCEFCDQDFANEKNLFIHIGHAHPECSAKTCEQCGQKCGSPSELKRHIANVHEKSKIWCSLCEKDISQNYFALHVKTVHEGIKRTCEFCQKGFSINNLKKHSELCRKRKKVEEVEEIFPFPIYGSNGIKSDKQMHLDEVCDELSSGPRKKPFWRPWDIRRDKKFVKDERIDFQSKRFQPKVRLQKLAIPSVYLSEIKVESNKNEKSKDETEEEQIDFQSKLVTDMLNATKGEQIDFESVVRAMAMFEAEDFKRPW